MNLTIDARLISSSGIGVYLQNIIKNDLLLNYDVALIHKHADKHYFNDIRSRSKLIEYNAELYSINELLNTPAKTRNTDIFWSPHYNVPLVNFASRLKLVTIHDVFHLAYYHTLSAAQKIYAKLMINRAVKTDLIFTVSEFSKAEILKHTRCNLDNVKVIYNGIDYKKFNSRDTNDFGQRILKSYKINSPYILFVGNVKPHKNLKKALQGFKEFIRNANGFEEYKFIIAGKREGFITADKEIDAMLDEPFYASKVQFTGWVKDEDLAALYQQAATFIFPSLYEGFGFPPLEAMAAGCPVISSDTACMPEVYQDAALYFNPLDVQQIAASLSDVLSNTTLRNNLIEKGLAQAAKYTWEAAAAEKFRLIKEYA